MNFNKAIILGNLTRDPERKTLPSGQTVTNFGVATNKFYTDQSGQKQQTVEFHNVVLFGKIAETAAQYLNKGSLVLIEGRLRTNNWVDNAGVKHYKTEIVAENMQLGPRTAAPRQQTNSYQPNYQTTSAPNQPINQTPKKNINIPEEQIPVIEEETTLEEIKEESEEDIDVKNIPF